jgi:hypothetical protein
LQAERTDPDLSAFWPELSKPASCKKFKSLGSRHVFPAVSVALRPIIFSNMDLFTVCALAIVAVPLITIVVLGGWFR